MPTAAALLRDVLWKEKKKKKKERTEKEKIQEGRDVEVEAKGSRGRQMSRMSPLVSAYTHCARARASVSPLCIKYIYEFLGVIRNASATYVPLRRREADGRRKPYADRLNDRLSCRV